MLVMMSAMKKCLNFTSPKGEITILYRADRSALRAEMKKIWQGAKTMKTANIIKIKEKAPTEWSKK
jgi:hypothetical protein